jgi:hypothetical protein
MRQAARILVAVLAVGGLATGCSSSVHSAISNLPSRTATATAQPTVTLPTTSPTTTPSPSVTDSPAGPTVTTSPAGPPSTQTVTATATATSTETATPTPTATASPGGGSGTGLLWLWILLGVAVLAGLIIWITRAAGHRSAATADWQSRLIDAYAKGAALHDAISVAETPGAMAAADSGARWSEVQRRADDLAQTLYQIREAASGYGDRARAEDTLASLQAVRSAMGAERSPGGASAEQAEVVRSRLAMFESSLQALRHRSDDVPGGP